MKFVTLFQLIFDGRSGARVSVAHKDGATRIYLPGTHESFIIAEGTTVDIDITGSAQVQLDVKTELPS